MLNKSLIIALGLVVLSGCTTPEPGSAEWFLMQEQEKAETQRDALESTLNEVPDWYVAPPTDEVSMYAAGTAVSSDLQFSIDKATLAAKRDLATSINSQMSSKMKQFIAESGIETQSDLYTESERVTTDLMADVNLSGYEVVERKMIESGGQYRAYVLARYPYGNANRLLFDEVSQNKKLIYRMRASEAFEELEHDIRAAREAAETGKY